jgi:hypothetical protein
VNSRPEAPLGYKSPIFRGVWERIKSFGALRVWAGCWVALWLFVGLWTLTYVGFLWLAVPFVCWLVGQVGLVWLTQWNDRFDDMAFAQWNRRYKDRYDAH